MFWSINSRAKTLSLEVDWRETEAFELSHINRSECRHIVEENCWSDSSERYVYHEMHTKHFKQIDGHLNRYADFFSYLSI